MSYWMFEVTHGASTRSDLYGATVLAQVFQMAALPPAERNVGGWVGPRPRVTRTGGVSSVFHTDSFTTTVAWLYEVPETNSAARTVAILQAVKDRITLNLTRMDPAVGHWSDVTVSPWAEGYNGAVTWWRGGFAARTTTEEEPPTLSTDANENPRGPTGADTHPTTPAETLEHMVAALGAGAQATTSLLWSFAAAGAVVLTGYGLYELSVYLAAARAVSGKEAPKTVGPGTIPAQKQSPASRVARWARSQKRP